jgi:hypothetical protein
MATTIPLRIPRRQTSLTHIGYIYSIRTVVDFLDPISVLHLGFSDGLFLYDSYVTYPYRSSSITLIYDDIILILCM